MKLVVRTAAFAAVAFTLHAANNWWHAISQPETSTNLAPAELRGGDGDAQHLRWFRSQKNDLDWRLIPSADAESIRDVNKALAESQQNPLILQFKQLDVEKARVEKWSGNYPQYFRAPSEKAGLMVQLPRLK